MDTDPHAGYDALHRWAALPVLALNALGETYAHLAAAAGIDTALMHRVAAISPGALAMLPHNGAVVTLVAICGATQRGSYREIMMAVDQQQRAFVAALT